MIILWRAVFFRVQFLMGFFVNKLQSGKEKFFLSRYECYGGTATDGLADWLTGTFSKCWVEADGFTADCFFVKLVQLVSVVETDRSILLKLEPTIPLRNTIQYTSLFCTFSPLDSGVLSVLLFLCVIQYLLGSWQLLKWKFLVILCLLESQWIYSQP